MAKRFIDPDFISRTASLYLSRQHLTVAKEIIAWVVFGPGDAKEILKEPAARTSYEVG